MQITKKFTFDMGHRLSDYDGKCRNIHGHTYLLEVTMEGELDLTGFVIDFGVLKLKVNSILDRFFDHKTVLKKGDSINEALVKAFPKDYDSYYLVDYNPTVENLVKDIYSKLESEFISSIVVNKLRLYETPTSYAEITKDDVK